MYPADINPLSTLHTTTVTLQRDLMGNVRCQLRTQTFTVLPQQKTQAILPVQLDVLDQAQKRNRQLSPLPKDQILVTEHQSAQRLLIGQGGLKYNRTGPDAVSSY